MSMNGDTLFMRLPGLGARKWLAGRVTRSVASTELRGATSAFAFISHLDSKPCTVGQGDSAAAIEADEELGRAVRSVRVHWSTKRICHRGQLANANAHEKAA
jgi:hypothetical protein